MTVPHVIYLAYGFPPAAKSGSFRLRAVANAFAERGWDVTTVSPSDKSWERDHGTDPSMLEGVHPRVRRYQLDLARPDLEPDLRRWDKGRAKHPDPWRLAFYEQSKKDFPEATFGAWMAEYRRAVEEIHNEHPADLLVASPMPYVTLDTARHLHRVAQVPYVIDYRDGWSVNVVTSEEAFTPDSREGVIEGDVLGHALQAWFVNPAIKGFYADRYPDLADRFRVVRNAFDPEFMGAPPHRTPVEPPLVLGYLGVMSLGLPQLRDLLDGWHLAREREPLLADARLEFRGHMGAGYSAGASGHAALVAARAYDGVSYLGPVPKAEVASVYASWDAIVLAIIGGRYMTSGKVYECLATGLPILSAHAVEHDATTVLQGYPLWAPARSLTPEDLADAFVEAARLAVRATPQERRAAAEHAAAFSRPAILQVALDDLLRAHAAVTTRREEIGRSPAAPAAPAQDPAAPVHAPRRVCMVAVLPVMAPAVRAAVRDLVAAGHEVRVISRNNPFGALHDLGVEFRMLKGVGPGRPKRGTPAWVAGQWRGRVVGRVARKLRPPRGPWLQVRSDAVASRWLGEADMVVALDRHAAYVAWQVAQRRPEIDAVLGLTETRLRLGVPHGGADPLG
ncbi:MAG TPA: hypothetical protein VM097_06955 [Mycobacteriales bacterium]|nr:hypothetical protein [Mycobacteriales bacterium]